MPVNIGDKPQADFTQPIELLMDCHRRIERFLQTLQRVAQDCIGGALDDAHREALRTSLDYFMLAGPRHNEDEEVSLFPVLMAAGNVEVSTAVKQMHQLADEHAVTDQLHHRLNALGRVWLETGQIAEPDLTEFKKMIKELISIYTPHIAMEEREIFPLASKVLKSNELANIGDQMRARRSANPGREGSRCSERRRHNGL